MNVIGTITGRMTGTQPNLQNIPRPRSGPQFKVDDMVKIKFGPHAGRHGVVTRVVTAQNDGGRRAGKPGRVIYDIAIADSVATGRPESFLEKCTALDVLADQV